MCFHGNKHAIHVNGYWSGAVVVFNQLCVVALDIPVVVSCMVMV